MIVPLKAVVLSGISLLLYFLYSFWNFLTFVFSVFIWIEFPSFCIFMYSNTSLLREFFCLLAFYSEYIYIYIYTGWIKKKKRDSFVRLISHEPLNGFLWNLHQIKAIILSNIVLKVQFINSNSSWVMVFWMKCAKNQFYQ